MKFEATIFFANRPNYNMRVYSEDTLDEAVSDPTLYKKNFSVNAPSDIHAPTDITTASHILLDVRKEVILNEVRYIGVFETLDTPLGTALSTMISDGIDLAVAAVGVGKTQTPVSENLQESDTSNPVGDVITSINNITIVHDYSIVSFSIIPAEAFNAEYKITRVE